MEMAPEHAQCTCARCPSYLYSATSGGAHLVSAPSADVAGLASIGAQGIPMRSVHSRRTACTSPPDETSAFTRAATSGRSA
eukprot:scaffold143264_cov31-Tisochrysis_lutea.AAC.4